MNAIVSRRSALTAFGAAALAPTAWGAAAMAKAAKPFFAAHDRPIGLQLYTVGAQASKDLDGTLKTISDIGYKTVEIAGYIGRSATDLRAALDKAGLSCTSAHIGVRSSRSGPSLSDDAGTLARDAHILGFKHIVLPSVSLPDRISMTPKPGEGVAAMLTRVTGEMTVDDWKANADFLNAKAKALEPFGITLGYHNHNFEFAPIGGTTGMDILLKGTDPSLVNIELDVGWLVAAGKDPVAWLKANGPRIRAMHVKDVGKGTKPNFALQQEPAEVGAGIIDWRAILPVAYKAGVRRFFVEQEPPFKQDPLLSIRQSFDYLAKLPA